MHCDAWWGEHGAMESRGTAKHACKPARSLQELRHLTVANTLSQRTVRCALCASHRGKHGVRRGGAAVGPELLVRHAVADGGLTVPAAAAGNAEEGRDGG